MATTTNYSWTTPDDTALVKDGAAAIRSLGTAIDTTVFNNASAGIAKTIVDAKGDIIAATAADTVSRLAVGSNDQVLTADSSTATGLKWAAPAAGGMTSIASGSLSGTSVTISSIPSTYNNLNLVIRNFYTGNSSELQFRFNSNSTAGVYGYSFIRAGSTSINNRTTSQAQISSSLSRTSDLGTFALLEIFDYANSTTNKRGMLHTQSNLTSDDTNATGGIFANITSAINSITILAEGDTFLGGTYILYGVK
jgi:hypothetical protein